MATAVGVFLMVSLLPGYSGTVSAQAPDVDILNHSAVSKLPDGIEFKASVSGDVQEITVRFSILGRRATQYDYLDFGAPGIFTASAPARGELFYRTDTLARYLPPGVTMEYTIEVFDSNGNVYETEPNQVVLYIGEYFPLRT